MRLLVKRLFCAALIAVASVCYGYMFPSYELAGYQEVRVGSGVTLWQIANAKYNEGAVPGMCFEEYYYQLRHVPANQELTANGRILQVADRVLVPVYRVVK